MSRKSRKKAIQRAAPFAPTPGGTMYTLPAGAIQSTYGQTFYGGSAKNIPTQGDALFSPGVPLYPVKGINPQGLPVQWAFAPQFNTQPVDRSMGSPDIPSFQQLRNFAKMYHGVTLCERVWFDLIPRMTLNIGLRKEVLAAGGDEKKYQKEITYFKKQFEKPDGRHDLHTWIRMALRDQTQIDELYIYKNRTRGGKLLGLELVAGDQMKPLLDQWGHIPAPPEYAYQQYPWGIPGNQYRVDQIIHYQESPATDTPYGFSRVERIIFNINLAIRKLKKDLMNFTAGNVPRGFVTVPADLNWTPDQIDAYQQMFNAMVAGSPEQQAKLLFMQPGMEYTKIDEFLPDISVDKFWLNTSASCYGLSMGDLSFTEDIHKSSGDSQQNVLYRRTVDPLAVIYAMFFTRSMEEDFDPSLHGDLLEASFGGFDEVEDEKSKAETLTMYTNAGILGLSSAAKLANLPEDPNAPPIGRVYMSKDGPIFLDDMASDDMRKAAKQAKMAGYEMATNPPQQSSGDAQETQGQDSPPTARKAQPKPSKHVSGNAATHSRAISDAETGERDASGDYKRWRTRAIEDKKANRAYRGFTTTLIPSDIHARISTELAQCETVQDVREVFERARQQETPAPSRELATDIAALFEDVERRGNTSLTH